MKKAGQTATVFALIACMLLSACAPSAHTATGETTILVSDKIKDMPVLVGNIPCSFPLAQEGGTLNILSTAYSGTDYNALYIWKKYEEMTGVQVNWTTVERDKRAQAVYDALATEQPLDLIIRCKLSSTKLTQFGEQGYILNLAEDGMLEKNAPNCWAYLQAHPETLASITNPDGSIYALPQVNSGAELRVGLKLFINKNWLKNVNMEVPTNTEEIYRLLKAFKDTDANGNGNANDEIPLCSANWDSIQQSFGGAFGLANRGMHNMTVDCDEATGGVRLIAAAESYKDFLAYFHTLYSEGLLDNNVFNMTDELWTNNAKNNLIGMFASTNLAWLPADMTDDWIALEEAPEGPNGDKMWTAIRANFHSTGAAALPATCKDPALALRWLDYFWTDEGTLFYHMGIEGETFEAKQDGTFDYMPYIYEEMSAQNKSYDDVIATYSPYPGGSNPTVEIAPYFMGGEMAPVPAQAARKLFEYGPAEYWPSFTFTSEENEKLNAIRADVDKYCSSARVDFITGVRPLSEWEDYLSQLESLKAYELLSIYEAAVKRYETILLAHS